MSYWSENETAVEEICAACSKTLEDHGGRGLCTCGHTHIWDVRRPKGQPPIDTQLCYVEPDEQCVPHPFEYDYARYCDWSKGGETFRRREPDDGY